MEAAAPVTQTLLLAKQPQPAATTEVWIDPTGIFPTEERVVGHCLRCGSVIAGDQSICEQCLDADLREVQDEEDLTRFCRHGF